MREAPEPQQVLQHELNIGNICGGVMMKRFDALLTQVFDNIADPNTPADAVREITVVFKLKPTKDRTGAAIVLNTKTSLTAKVIL